MKTLKFAAILTAGATLALSHIPAAAQAAANPVSLAVKIQVKPEGAEIVEMLPGRTAAAAGFTVSHLRSHSAARFGCACAALSVSPGLIRRIVH